jgi:hypothetical protein
VISHQTVFRFGEDFPAGRIFLDFDVQQQRKLYHCNGCGLWYFSHIPTKDFLKELMDQPQLANRWSEADRSRFDRASAAIQLYLGSPGAILDIGAHTGGFLKSLGDGWRKYALEPMVYSSQQIGDDIELFNDFLKT